MIKTLVFYLEFCLETSEKEQKIGGKVSGNIISSTDGPEKSTETRQRCKKERRLPYYGMIVEKKDKKTTQHLLYTFADVG